MNKIALVTGALGGIGRATADAFAGAGWYVIGSDLHPVAEVAVPATIGTYVAADVSDVGDSAALFDRVRDVVRETGRSLAAIVNNAAVQVCKTLVDTTPEEWDAVLASNLRSAYLTVKNGHPLLREHGGSIVNVSSVHALATSNSIAAYAASKGGLLALTRALAIELAADRIRVNAVLPGAVDTPMLRAGLARRGDAAQAEQVFAELAGKHLGGRIGVPREIAEAILFLSRDETASFITGQALVVDGGATIRLSTE